MALDLDGSQYLTCNDIDLAGAEPFTLSFWMRPDTTGSKVPMSIGDSAAAASRHYVLRVGGTPYCRLTSQDSVTGSATVNPSGTTNTWVLVICTVSATNSREFYIGGSTQTNATNVTGIATDQIRIGSYAGTTPAAHFPGQIAEVGLWDVALSSGDKANLLLTYAPSLVDPTNLVRYWPLIDSATESQTGATTTPTGSPTYTTHPPIIYGATRMAQYYARLRA